MKERCEFCQCEEGDMPDAFMSFLVDKKEPFKFEDSDNEFVISGVATPTIGFGLWVINGNLEAFVDDPECRDDVRFEVYNYGGDVEIEYSTYTNDVYGKVSRKINFCPMCGRKF